MTTASTQEPALSDAELITATREGSSEAYAELYSRHRAAAYNLARQLARSRAESDDLVSEAFAKLLDTLRSGGGPDSAFRAYLLTALRHCAYDRTRRERRIELSDDIASYDPGVPFTDTAVVGLDRSLAARAFARLPERWQTVLWHTEIEGESPATVAPLLGLTPNGVSALAYRAREGLKQAYLQVHLADTAASGAPDRELERCRAAVDRLGAWTRSGLSKRETAQVEQHLDECDQCRALAAELADVNGGLRVFVAPLVLGSATAGYLTAAALTTGAATAVVTGVGTIGAGTTGTGATSSASGVVSGGPRQFLTVAGSVSALVAAVVVGLATGPGDAARPAAAVPNQPPVVSEQPPPGTPPSPPATDEPEQPDQDPTTEPPADQPDQPDEPGPDEPAPPADQPILSLLPPPLSLTLEAGGPPVSLPIAVRNNGSAPSDPVVAQLNLPAGVSAVGSGNTSQNGAATEDGGGGGNGPAGTGPQFASSAVLAQGGVVSCTGGSGAIRCTTTRGLAAGEQVTFTFTLRAAADAAGGQVTGTISAGSTINLRLAAVRVVVRPAPDGIDLRASAHRHTPFEGTLTARVTNVGRSAGQVTTTVSLPDGVHVMATSRGCKAGRGTVRCTSNLGPGGQASWNVWLAAVTHVRANATVTAVLGTAQQSRTVLLELGLACPRPPGVEPSCPPGHVPGWPIGLDLELELELIKIRLGIGQ